MGFGVSSTWIVGESAVDSIGQGALGEEFKTILSET